jgi:DNA-binding NtrC family response regulator
MIQLPGGTGIVARAGSFQVSAGDRGAGWRRMNLEQKNPTILIVDDEEPMLTSISEVLSRGGYRVLTASGISSCVEQMKTHGSEIDLVMIDVSLRFESGFDLADILERDFRFHRHVFMTAFFWQEKIFSQLLHRGKPYFEKPIKFQSELFPFLRDYFSKRESKPPQVQFPSENA